MVSPNMKLMTFFMPVIRRIPVVLLFATLLACAHLDEDVQLRQIRDVVVDASSDPTLKANAIFFNPNDAHGKLRKIDVEVFVNGKKAAHVDQKLKLDIPAKAEFTIPLEVKLNIKELGFMDTLLGMVGGKKFKVRYEGYVRVTHHGIPIKVPVKYEDEIKVRF